MSCMCNILSHSITRGSLKDYKDHGALNSVFSSAAESPVLKKNLGKHNNLQ